MISEGNKLVVPRAFIRSATDAKWHNSFVFAIVSPAKSIQDADKVLPIKRFEVKIATIGDNANLTHF